LDQFLFYRIREKEEIFNPKFLLLLLSLCSVLGTEQPDSTPHHCNSSTVIPLAANRNDDIYSQDMSSLEKLAVLHFSLRGCSIQEVKWGKELIPIIIS